MVSPQVYDCSIPTPRDVLDFYDFEIPKVGVQDTRTIFVSSADYISTPIVDCIYTYSLETCGGNSLVEDRYNILSDGKITIDTDGDAPLIDDELRVVINSMSVNQ